MSNTKVEDAILQTIDLIASKRVAAAGYNKTIQVTIVACENESSGKYKAKYQDGYFYVYGDPDIYYAPGQRVQVLVPNGDMSKDKTIMGTVRVLGTNYETITNEEQIYDTIGRNIILNSESFSIDLSSYKTEVQILYDKSQSDNLLEIDIEEAEEYIKQSSSIKLSAIISTNLDIQQRYNGDYGIVLGLNFKDNAAEEPITRYYVMNIDTMTGNPYFYPNATLQSKVFEIDSKNFVDIDTISVYTKDFPIQNEYSLVYDIHMRDLSLGSVRILSSDDLKGYSLNLITRKGYIFTADSLSTDTRTFEAQLRAQSKLIAMDSNEVSIYWFIQNVSVTAANQKYSSYGGQGWECLNDYEVVKEAVWQGGIIVKPRVIEYIPGSAILTIQKTDVLTRQTKYKCVVIYGNNRLDKEFSVIRRDADYQIIITSDSGTEFYYNIGSPTLTCTCYHKENDQMVTVDPENLKFIWGTTDSSGVFELLPDQSINTDKVKLKAIQSAIEQLLNIEYILYEQYYDVEKVFIDDVTINNIQDATLREQLRSIKQSLVDVGITRIEDISNLFFTYNVEVIPNVTTYNLLLYGNSAHSDTLIKAINNLSDSQNVVKNKVIDVNIKRITGFSIFKCSVFTKVGNYFIGTGNIIVTNSLSAQNLYTLIINNGSQVFKYSTTGISPTSKRNEIPLVIPSLSFTIYDNLGNPIEQKDIESAEISWIVPNTQTMLEISSEYSGIPDSTLTNMIYNDLKIFNYGIVQKYIMDYNRNNITLKVNYNDMNLVATTNLTFTKQGEDGTNGTDIVCRIVPVVTTGETPLYPTIYFDQNGNVTKNWNSGSSPWFKVQIWNNNNEPIFSGTNSGSSTEGKQVTIVKWEPLINNYGGSTYKDKTNLIVTQNNLNWSFGFSKLDFPYNYPDQWQSWMPANILKVTVSYDGYSLYATLPIISCYRNSSYNNYSFNLKDYTGFRRVLYNSAGLSPKYDSHSSFEIVVKQQIAPNHWQDVSLKESSDYSLKYSWYYQGSVLYKSSSGNSWTWVQDSEQTIPISGQQITNVEDSSKKWLMKANYTGETLKKNEKKIKPVDKYNGQCVNVGLGCKIIKEESNITIGWIHIPIHMSFNRFENSAINGWDGNSVNLGGNNGGMIIAPQVGAGVKNPTTNTFTGLFMGTAKDPNSNLSTGSGTAASEEVGLFGYKDGVRTIFLDSKTGQAVFGAQNAGQIILDPSNSRAEIRSGNYSTTNGTGMLIDLTTPEIKFGSGRFQVDSQGKLQWRSPYSSLTPDGKLKCTDAQISGKLISRLTGSVYGRTVGIYAGFFNQAPAVNTVNSFFPSLMYKGSGSGTSRQFTTNLSTQPGYVMKAYKNSESTPGIGFSIAPNVAAGYQGFSLIFDQLDNSGYNIATASSAPELIYRNLNYGVSALYIHGGLTYKNLVKDATTTENDVFFTVKKDYIYWGHMSNTVGGGNDNNRGLSTTSESNWDEEEDDYITNTEKGLPVLKISPVVIAMGKVSSSGGMGYPSIYITSNTAKINTQDVVLSGGSSKRYKHSIKLLQDENLDYHKLLNLPVKQFIYNNQNSNKMQYRDMAGKIIPGFIAEDVEEVYPSAVIHNENDQIQNWDVRRIVPGMLGLIQQQHKRINQLEKLVKEIKGE